MSDGAAQAMGSPAPSPGGGAWWPRFAILLVVLLAWLPGLATLPPLDRDESRFAEASRQMVETGNFVDIRFAGTTRYNKPIGIYWLQAASAALAGPAMRDRIFVYRLPSLLAGFLCLLMVYECGRRLGMRHRALFASLLLGTTLLLVAESDIATTDAALLATVIAAQLTMMRTYLSVRDSRYAKPGLARIMGGWAALGAGVLLKGPVILAVVGATALALSLWDREWRWLRSLRPLSGILVAAAIVAPWAIAIGYASHGAFYQQSLGHDFAAKILGGEESHGAPPGYYLALASFTFWPATLLLLPALADAVGQRRDPVYRYLLAWSGSVWLMFEFVPTKLPHYILPVWPALALLCALWIGRASIAKSMRGQTWLRAAGAAQFGLGAIGLVAASLYLPPHNGGSLEWPALVAAALVLAWGCAAILFLLRQHYERAAVLAVASAVLFYLLLGFAIVPQLHE
ncbi:MAG TPA: glycosyltransferase family 39 protein, partial [Rhizomicrobium sp.]